MIGQIIVDLPPTLRRRIAGIDVMHITASHLHPSLDSSHPSVQQDGWVLHLHFCGASDATLRRELGNAYHAGPYHISARGLTDQEHEDGIAANYLAYSPRALYRITGDNIVAELRAVGAMSDIMSDDDIYRYESEYGVAYRMTTHGKPKSKDRMEWLKSCQ